MTARKLGNELFRLAPLLHRDRSLWQHFGTHRQGSSCVLFSVQLHGGVSRLWVGHGAGRPSVGYHRNAVRLYSQDGTGWQGLSEPKALSRSSEDAADLQPLPEEDRNAVPPGGVGQRVLFYNQLKACQSPTDVLDLVSKYTLSWRRVSNSLTRLWETAKRISEEQRRYELQLMFEHPVFGQLCRQVMRDAPRMRNDDVAYSLLAVVKLGVPQRSRVVQTLLRTIQEKLNEFDEKSLSVLATCLEDMDSCKNVDALREGLRLLVEGRIPGIRRVMTLQTLMRCVGRDAPTSLKRKLEQKALSMTEQFTLPNAQYMLVSLAAMNHSSKPLLDICNSKIAESVHCIPFTRLIDLLRASKQLQYRDVHLLSAVAEYLTSTFEMWNTKQLVLLLLLFEEMGFRPVALLDKVSEKMIRDSDSLMLKDLLSFLKVYSMLNYIPQQHTPEFLESVTRVLESYLPKMAPTELLRGIFSLCILGHIPLALLERLVQTETVQELRTKDGKFSRMNQQKLHYVNLCLHLDLASLPQDLTIPPVTIPPPSNSKYVNQSLVKALQSIVGEGAVEEGVLLENGYSIDCLVTLSLKKPDLCSPSEEESVSLESVQRVAVLCPPGSFFCLGTRHPRGMLAMKLRHLQALGYSPVLVPEPELVALSEEERAKVLTDLIFGVKGEDASVNSEQERTRREES
ncbi:FAST kinase domain-containing protein 2, mitochondrial [Megalops cyprinoides]|uniref:FAST kinase domain-containing protein 2, mitochondrial n=1 Tax=Megalops cyprinoides TaxID=118141 RepID=UPI0018652ED4|nr:FAST kinase domain-containing protein 2, mitochondrial [Megalops cyprinoides]XP_036401389.1 FAST kinase domain-containing protein 2, mitochondrial [Megalops cyprinoides]